MGIASADEARRRLRDRTLATARRALRTLHETRYGWVLTGRPAEALRQVAFTVRPAEVVAIVDACESAGARVWLAGGWGVDALLGRHTRRHTDLDLCVDVAGDGEARAVAALASRGYEVTDRRAPSGSLFPVRLVLRDRTGRVVDLLLVRVASPEHDGARRPEIEIGDAEQLPVVPLRELAEGEVGGRRLGCLGEELQLRAHLGYAPKKHDFHDVALLCAKAGLKAPGPYSRPRRRRSGRARTRAAIGACARFVRLGEQATAVVIEVPTAAPLLAAVGCPTALGATRSMGPHVTVCFPFVPGRALDVTTRDALAEVARRVEPFEARFERLACFPGVVHLPALPAAPFVTLTEELVARFPDHPAYEGAFDEVIPHLTIAYDLEPDDVVDTVKGRLPLHTEVTELAVAVCDRWGRWAVRYRFPLGGGASSARPQPALSGAAAGGGAPRAGRHHS